MYKTSHRQRKLNVEGIQAFFKLSSILNNFAKPCYEQSHTKNVWLHDRREGNETKAWNTYFVQRELKAICEQRNKSEKGPKEKITKRLTCKIEQMWYQDLLKAVSSFPVIQSIKGKLYENKKYAAVGHFTVSF